MTNWLRRLINWLKGTPPAPPPPTIEKPAASAKPTAKPSEAQTVPPAPPPVTSIQKAETPVADLHIGFDLGTSCSKVAIGDNFLDRHYGVPFNERAPGVDRYLFPTAFYERPEGVTLNPLDSAPVCSDLKLRLIEASSKGSDTSQPEIDLAIYMALVLNHTFAWYEKHHRSDHRTRRWCWWLNVGLPVKRVENNPRLHEAYRRAGNAAISAVNSAAPITRELVRACLAASPARDDMEPRLSDNRLHFYPEIAAQLACYAYSPYRRDGPLLLVDVGAGTLDISTLIIHRAEDQEICSFHFCEVAPLGAFRLYREVYDALSRIAPDSLKPSRSSSEDLAWHVPDSLHDYLHPGAVQTPSLRSFFHQTRSSFAGRCLDVCQSNFSLFKRSIDEPARLENRRPRVFREHVNFILSGGGSRSPFYREIFPDSLEKRLLNLTSWAQQRYQRQALNQGLCRIHFTPPTNFLADDVGAEDFDRLSAAHGLSLGSETLMKITAKEASDRQWTPH